MQQVFAKNRWMVLVFAMICQCITTFPSGWGVFQPYVVSEFGYGADAATFVMPLCVVAFGVFSIIGGRVQDTLSPKIASIIGVTMIGISFFNVLWIPTGIPMFMYIGFSLFFGGGCGFLFTSCFSVSMKWFPDKKGFAQGLSGSISAVYVIALTYIGEYLLSNLGVRKTFMVFGIVSVVLGYIIAFVMVNPSGKFMEEKSRLAAQKDGGKAKKPQPQTVDFTAGEMLRTKQYYFLIFSIITIMPAFMLLNPAIVSIGMERGLTKEAALSILAISSAATAAGRLIVPWVSDYLGRKRTMFIMWVCVAVTATLFMFANGYQIIVIYSLLAFFYSGGYIIIGPITSDLFGFKNSGTNYGFVTISNSAGSLIGPMIQTVFTPLLGANTKSLVGIGGAVIATVLIACINTDMATTKQRLDSKKKQTVAQQ